MIYDFTNFLVCNLYINRKSKGKHNSLKLQMSLTSEYSLCQIPSILTLQQPITWKNIINKAPIQHRALTTIKKP